MSMIARPGRMVAAALTALTLAVLGALTAPPAASAAPTPTITKVSSGLTIPWDVTWVGGVMLVNERGGAIYSQRGTGARKRVTLPMPRLFARSEGGLLGMVADPDAASRHFYTCQSTATSSGGASDLEVWKWRLTSDTTAVKVAVLITGLPVGTGRHNGCRLQFRSDDYLYVGTGDAAGGTRPQDLNSLAGKVLRVRKDGYIPRTNPFYDRGGRARYIWSYGHRNIQGLAKRPGNSQIWSAEHGSYRDDEVNRVVEADNYGWNPVPGYNEQVPMTDLAEFPRAVRAKWSSGPTTVATSGATFLDGSQWKEWDGYLAVALLKGQGIQLFSIDSRDVVTKRSEIATSYGRIRTVEQGPDGALYFTTSNGSGQDAVYRMTVR